MNLHDYMYCQSIAADYLVKYHEEPWKLLDIIPKIIIELGDTLLNEGYVLVGDNIYVGKNTKISEKATLCPYTIIGHDTEVRPGAYIRGNAIIGDSCVIGNSCEIKNSIICDKSQIPHFNYVGDSILGYHAHLGAGVILSNVKSDNSNVIIRTPSCSYDTGRRKVGSIIGDYAEIGCNSVLNPGTVVGTRSRVYPLSMVRGYIPANSIYKSSGVIVDINKDDLN